MSIEWKQRNLNALLAFAFGAGCAHAAPDTAAAPEVPAQAAAASESSAGEDNAQVLDRVRVEGKGEPSYVSPVSVGGKEARSLKEIPGSASVITQERIREQNLVTVADALNQAPGVTVISNDTTQSQYWSRGYALGVMNDGIPTYSALSGYEQLDLAVYEQVEILRGPAGLFQGSGDLGGIVNLVRKRAKDAFALEGSVSAGSWDNYRASVDVTGPLDEAKAVRARAVVATQDRHYFYDRTHDEKQVAYGTLDWDLTTSDTVSFATAWQDDRTRSPYTGLPADATTGALLNVDRSTNPYPDWNRYHWDTQDYIAEYEHRFANLWKARVRLMRRDQGFYFKDSYPSTGVSAAGTLTYARRVADYQYRRDAADLFLSGEFDAFGRRHEAIVGYNFDRFTYDYVRANGVSVVTGVPFGRPDLVPEFDGTPYDTAGESATTQSGYYAQLRLGLLDPLTLVAGGRLSDFYGKSRTATPATLGAKAWTEGAKANDEFTPNGALIYALTREISAYAGYAEIFVPTSSLKISGEPLDPRHGQQYELGAKGEFLGGRLNASLALFKINDVNRAFADPANIGYYLNAGKAESKGWEAEVSGSPARGWNLQAGYTRLDTTYVRDRNNQGLPYDTWEPRHTLKFWGTHQFDDGASLGGITLGLGADVVSSSAAGNGSSAIRRQGGYAVWNAFASYALSRGVSLAFNANNLFDKTYYTRLGGLNTYNTYGEPRNFALTLRAAY